MACRRPEKPAADPLVGLMDGLGIFPNTSYPLGAEPCPLNIDKRGI